MDQQLANLIRSDVLNILPDIDSKDVEALANKLVDSRIQSLTNLQYVKEDEITEFVGIYDARKLVETWKKRGSNTAGPSTSSSGHARNSASVPLGERLQHSSYTVNWTKLLPKMPDEVENLLRRKRVLDNKLLDAVIRVIVQAVKKDMPNYRRDCLSDIARDIISLYPHSFKDIQVEGKAGMELKTDCERLTYKMRNRSDNTNRGEKTGLQREAPDIPEASGCVQWAVSDLPDGEDEESLEIKIIDMQTTFEQVSSKEWDWDDIKEKMSLTYGLQRADLNSQIPTRGKKRKRGNEENYVPDTDGPIKKTTDEILERFPFLITTRGMNQHFHTLTKHHDFAEDLMKWMSEVQSVFIDYLASRHPENPSIRHQMRKAQQRDTCKEDDSELMAVILMLVNCLKEDIEGLIKFVLPGTPMVDVSRQHAIPATPCLYGIGRNLFHCRKFYFSLDSKVRSSVPSFRSGLLLIFCSYYVFNLTYPDGIANTLDFIQRAIVGIDSAGKSRVPRKKRGPNKVAYAIMLLRSQCKVYLEQLEEGDDN